MITTVSRDSGLAVQTHTPYNENGVLMMQLVTKLEI